MQWTNSLSVNVGEIDSQHQKLVRLINDLGDAMRVGKGKDLLGKTIAELASYTVAHFSTEEKYFDKFGYPDAATHKVEHKKFIEEVSKFKKDFDSGNVGLSTSVMNFLSDWLKNHIMGKDKKYGPFFNEKGLK
ncbi:MAG TPA: bacteriohemerythrin [Syntrophorhabdales bacterium]|nr:bacteriohemerythrin [Syntrophorhabdales bacterium]